MIYEKDIYFWNVDDGNDCIIASEDGHHAV